MYGLPLQLGQATDRRAAGSSRSTARWSRLSWMPSRPRICAASTPTRSDPDGTAYRASLAQEEAGLDALAA